MRKKVEQGTTLLELVMVMIIIFVLAGALAPRFSDFVPALRVRKTTDQVLATLLKARTDSALLGCRHRVYFDLSETSRKFWIGREMRPLNQPGTFTDLGGSWAPSTYPDDVKITAEGLPMDGQYAAYYVDFSVDGTASQDVSIVIFNDRGETRTIKVESATGKVYIDPQAATNQPGSTLPTGPK